MKIELPKNWKFLAGVPLTEAVDKVFARKLKEHIFQADDKTLNQLEKMIKTRKEQLKKHIEDLQPGAFKK